MSKHTPEQMAEREAEVRADHKRLSKIMEGQEPDPAREDVGALLEILDAERATKAELLEALKGLESRHEPGVFCDHAAAPCHRCDAARVAIAKAEGKP